MNGPELREIRTSMRLSQSEFKRLLNIKLGRSFDTPKISRMESAKSVPEDVANVALELKNEAPQEARIIVFANQKGGVGKTTTAINIAYGLSRGGKRVLLIDMDPQATASLGVLLDGAALAHQAKRTMANVILEDVPIADAIIRAGEKIGEAPAQPFAVAASHINLSAADARADVALHTALLEAIDTIRRDFDFIVIDAPPHLGMLTGMSLIAATDAIIPVRTEPYDSMGVGLILETIKRIQRRANPSLRLRGIIPTQFDRRKAVDRRVIADLCEMLNGEAPVLHPVPDSAIFGRAAFAGRIALAEQPTNAAVAVYNDICECLNLGEPFRVFEPATLDFCEAGDAATVSSEGSDNQGNVGRPTTASRKMRSAQ